MATTYKQTNNTRSHMDNEILKKPSVVAWLDTLGKEFALHHCTKSTRKAYRGWIVNFIIWKYSTHCMDVAEAANRRRGYYQ